MKALALLVPLFGLSACGADNVTACRAFIEHFNGLPCVSEAERYDDTSCPETLNGRSLDCTAYYACVTEQSTCDADGDLVFDDQACAGCLLF